MAGTSIIAGICTSPSSSLYPIEKSGIPHTHTQSMRGFTVKTRTGSDNTHGDGFICHLYWWYFKGWLAGVPWVVVWNVFLELWLGIVVKHVAFLELWLRMKSLELWLEMADEHEQLLSCSSRWRMNTRNSWIVARVGECCRCECARCGVYRWI